MKTLINISDISSYIFCPRKLYLKKVHGLKEPLNEKMILGMIKHKILELFSKSEENLISSINSIQTKSSLLTLYENSINNLCSQAIFLNRNLIRRFNISEKEILNSIASFLNREIQLRINSILATQEKFLGKPLWENLSPKYLSELSIESEDLGLKGRIDRVKIDSEIIPYEIKTRAEVYEGDRIQLAGYALLLESKFNQKIEKGVVETETSNQEVALTQELKERVLEIAEEIRNFEKNEPEFPANFQKCQKCVFNKECYGSE